MSIPTIAVPKSELMKYGLKMSGSVHYQCTPQELIAQTIELGEGTLSDTGALVVNTGEFTGRSPKDKYTVLDDLTRDTIDWNDFNIPMSPARFENIYRKVREYLNQQKEIWVRDCTACADPRYRLNIRLVCEKPWTSLFAHNMFLRLTDEEAEDFSADWHVLSAPGLKLDASECGTRQHNATIISFTHKVILIAGSGYTGETKKGIFTILNYILPQHHNVLSMHCSANMGAEGDTALFFGLSGTGKTTLSADPSRKLIGDDEHGWTEDNVFNFEGGCYAKTIDLNEEKEPDIFKAIRKGALVENTPFLRGTRTIDFNSRSITENTRVSYPLNFIRNSVIPSIGNIPENIFFLTCDAYGILPPISRLTPSQAMYQFISGYTAKVAGTETGISEPKATFSACFGAPFLPLHPAVYASMLGEKLRKHKVNVWLINTGWTGGPYGTGKRIKLCYTRAMISAALNGDLYKVDFVKDPVFGLSIPTSCPNVPPGVLNPRNTWADQNKYDLQARTLVNLFTENFKKYSSVVSEDVRNAGPALD
jgi:phosphoenolpyruvate carboxykinase (ATP)